MGMLGSLLGIGPAHQVQSKRGEAGFQGFGDDQMGGLMHNDSGMSRPDQYNGGYPMNPMTMFGGMGGMSGGQGMGQQGGMGPQRPQGYPYGIQPPQGMQRTQQQQPQQNNPLAGIFNMLGGL